MVSTMALRSTVDCFMMMACGPYQNNFEKEKSRQRREEKTMVNVHNRLEVRTQACDNSNG